MLVIRLLQTPLQRESLENSERLKKSCTFFFFTSLQGRTYDGLVPGPHATDSRQCLLCSRQTQQWFLNERFCVDAVDCLKRDCYARFYKCSSFSKK